MKAVTIPLLSLLFPVFLVAQNDVNVNINDNPIQVNTGNKEGNIYNPQVNYDNVSENNVQLQVGGNVFQGEEQLVMVQTNNRGNSGRGGWMNDNVVQSENNVQVNNPPKSNQIPRGMGTGSGSKMKKKSGLKSFFYKMGKSFQKTFHSKRPKRHHTSRCGNWSGKH